MSRTPGGQGALERLVEARARTEPLVGAPSDWLLHNSDLIDPAAPVLDVACGRGRHALLLAAAGWRVHAIDRSAEALEALAASAGAVGATTLTTEPIDLETGAVNLGHERYGTVLVFNYLHRPLMPALVTALAAGGVLLYETFTIGQAARGRPRDPAFLLQPGEIARLVHPLVVLRSREGDIDGRLIASLAAARRRPV